MILDSNGQPVEAESEPEVTPVRCPKCGRPTDKFRERFNGFGGFWKDLCKHCGHVFAEGRD